jgi:hypothetical protein
MLQRTRITAIATGLLMLLFLSGCGGGAGPRAKVKGKVTFNDRPVPAGTITFFGTDKRSGTAQLKQDGSYEIADAPVGEVTITVETPDKSKMMGPVGQDKRPPGVGSMPADMDPGKSGLITSPDKIVSVPAKYFKSETSPLKYTVLNQEQEYDVKLTP